MKERPILFNGDMVRAILDGRKKQTRRPVSPQPRWVYGESLPVKTEDADPKGEIRCPYGTVGDRLWVRETTFADHVHTGHIACARYAADDKLVLYPGPEQDEHGEPDYGGSLAHWWYKKDVCPSIHMPRWAARIILEITAVRVERVQDISEDDAMAEGGLEAMVDDHVWYIPGYDSKTTRDPISAFEHVWNACYSARGLGWDANPWVWVIDFKMVEVD